MHSQAPSAPELNTLFAIGTRFNGKLTFEGGVRIDGYFEGEIQSEGTLVVGETGEIVGEIAAGTVIVRGKVRGNILAKESIEIFAPSSVTGNIEAPTVTIERGVAIQGSCKMG